MNESESESKLDSETTAKIDITLVNDRIIPLSTVSNDTGIKEHAFIAAARDGEIELIFSRPAAPYVAALSKTNMHDGKKVRVLGIQNYSPNYFILDRGHCTGLLRADQVDVYSVKTGYHPRDLNFSLIKSSATDASRNKYNDISIMSHYGSDPLSETDWQEWVFAIGITPSQITVRLKDVYMRLGELHRCVDLHIPKIITDQPVGLGTEIKPKTQIPEYMSEKLQHMNAEAKSFWNRMGILRDDMSTHPENKTVVERFRRISREDGSPVFEGESAKHAATFIRPSWGKGSGRPEKRTGTVSWTENKATPAALRRDCPDL